MGLASVSQTALSGMAAASLSIDVVANNLANPSGLEQGAGTSFSAGPNSGLPAEGSATITAGATELSNTDVGQSLVDLSTASVLFRANVQVLATGEGMFDQLLDLTRRS